MKTSEPQVPTSGPLSSIEEKGAWTGVSEKLYYGGEYHLRKCFRIDIDLLHFNIENGRYASKYQLLKKSNPGVTIDATEPYWKNEMFKLLSGVWEDARYGVSTKSERPMFEALAEDIGERGQERPGIVLETGGVISGNRRLAALIHLFQKAQNPRYKYLEAFIVPSGAQMSTADRWRLEMSAQIGQGRLTKGYEAVDLLLKIREGVGCLMEQNPRGGEESAIKAIANDLARAKEDIEKELATLRAIEEYLNAIGHPEEWWQAKDSTEVFTEIVPLMEACDRNAMPFEDRSKLKRMIYQITSHDEADYRLIRDIRSAVGSGRMRKTARTSPTAIRVLLNNAPSSDELRKPTSPKNKVKVKDIIDRFQSEYQASREQEAPLTKAERAESNLRKLVEMLREDKQAKSMHAQDLIEKLTSCRSLADDALKIMNGYHK